jgi:hypothetical protein
MIEDVGFLRLISFNRDLKNNLPQYGFYMAHRFMQATRAYKSVTFRSNKTDGD